MTKKVSTMFCSFQATLLTKTSFTGLSCSLRVAPLLSSSFTEQSLQSNVAGVTLWKREGRASRMTTRAMFEYFTEKSFDVIILSQEEARRMGHKFVGTEQILLGLLREGMSIAASVLQSLGINLKNARVEAKKITSRGSGFVAVDQIPFTPRAESVLELTLKEARKLGHNYIGPEHFLLGLLREGEGIGVRVLENLGVDLLDIRTEVIIMLCENNAIGAGNNTPPPEEEAGMFHYLTVELLKKMRNRRQDFQEGGEHRDTEMDTEAHISAPVLQNKENENKFPAVLTISFNGEPANYTVDIGAPHSISTLSISSSEKVKMVIGFSETSETYVTIRN